MGEDLTRVAIDIEIGNPHVGRSGQCWLWKFKLTCPGAWMIVEITKLCIDVHNSFGSFWISSRNRLVAKIMVMLGIKEGSRHGIHIC